jgi:RNA polymerase sigma-70 factor (ECF subfamily)
VESDLSAHSPQPLETATPGTAPDPADAVALGQDVALLRRALDDLAPLDRMVVTLLHLEERSVKETAGLLDMSVANVKVRAFRARRKLRDALSGLEPQGGG